MAYLVAGYAVGLRAAGLFNLAASDSAPEGSFSTGLSSEDPKNHLESTESIL